MNNINSNSFDRGCRSQRPESPLGKRKRACKVSNNTNPTPRKGKWTDEEDFQLRRTVQRLGPKCWKKIAKSIPGRTDVQCLHRWQRVTDPSLQKGSWSKEEDDVLRYFVLEKKEKNWASIAKHLPTKRNGKQCRERWCNHLDPTIRRGAWSTEEIQTLLKYIKKLGKKWSLIAVHLPGRPANSIKNKWNSKLKREYPEIESSLSSKSPQPSRRRNSVAPLPKRTLSHSAPSQPLQPSIPTAPVLPPRSHSTGRIGLAHSEPLYSCVPQYHPFNGFYPPPPQAFIVLEERPCMFFPAYTDDLPVQYHYRGVQHNGSEVLEGLERDMGEEERRFEIENKEEVVLENVGSAQRKEDEEDLINFFSKGGYKDENELCLYPDGVASQENICEALENHPECNNETRLDIGCDSDCRGTDTKSVEEDSIDFPESLSQEVDPLAQTGVELDEEDDEYLKRFDLLRMSRGIDEEQHACLNFSEDLPKLSLDSVGDMLSESSFDESCSEVDSYTGDRVPESPKKRRRQTSNTTTTIGRRRRGI